MIYTITEISSIVKGKFLNARLFDYQVERLLFDSRHLVFPNKTIFFAFKSNRQNGHAFIDELYRQGVKNFVISELVDIKAYPDANFILVENAVEALQRLAEFHRNRFSLPTIGITGSNGKTIVKEWLFQLLHEDYNIVRNPGSYNSQIGVPLSVWLIDEHHDLGIFEAGISQKGEMQNLASIIDCEIGIFTNIGTAHSEGFDSQTEKIQEKLQLFKQAKTLLYCKDHVLIDKEICRLEKKSVFTWGKDPSSDIQILEVSKTGTFTRVQLRFKKALSLLNIPFKDDVSLENICHCVALLIFLEVPLSTIQSRTELLEPVSMRLELKPGINGCTIINDSYNSDFTSLEYALNYAIKINPKKQFVLILSDILQSGLPPGKLYRQVALLVEAKKVDHLIIIGEAIKLLEKILPSNQKLTYFRKTSDFLNHIKVEAFYNSIVLLKGARTFQFEKIIQRFEEKVHKTVLEVNLNSLVHNLKTYSQYLQPSTKLMAMVKASAYGSGSIEVAKTLEFYRVDYLGVAYADEGVELRKAGIQLPIIVINPEESSFENVLHYHLEPEMYSLSMLEKWISFLPEGQDCSIHIKLDTGMHRLGFEPSDLEELVRVLLQYPNIKVGSVFSHLAASDAAEHDEYTEHQVEQFLKLYASFEKALSYRPLAHILNSSGIVRFPQYQLDMVRLGIGLYGVDSSELIQSQLEVVNTLKSTISQIKELKRNDTVGYNRSGKIETNQRIATINIGYADGLARKAGNGNFSVIIHQLKAPIIGNVCMDMCMVDVTHIPDAKEGDEAIIFGEYPTVSELAHCLETIPYEIFTRVSKRVKRIYFRQ